jgi:hypothetical protein
MNRMSERPDDKPESTPESTPEKRGEAAWKAMKADIAARNDKVRRAGRAERQEIEEQAAARRRAVERNERADLRREFGGR